MEKKSWKRSAGLITLVGAAALAPLALLPQVYVPAPKWLSEKFDNYAEEIGSEYFSGFDCTSHMRPYIGWRDGDTAMYSIHKGRKLAAFVSVECDTHEATLLAVAAGYFGIDAGHQRYSVRSVNIMTVKPSGCETVVIEDVSVEKLRETLEKIVDGF